jgi:N-acetylmuramoyl-L-alanine amidase
VTVSPRRPFVALLITALLLAGCGQPQPSSPSGSPSPPSASSIPSSPIAGEVIPAPGSNSELYAPNPGALVVAIDPGHGGCLDWGVPDPRQRGVPYSEKTMTLAIGTELRRLLEAQGVTVVMTRTDDQALAGDDYPDLGCHGPPWRDVNGDGESGFHPDDLEGKVRTRDELQARLDLANVTRADILISIHINALTQDGVVVEIAATETYYTDETAWGTSATERLASLIQREVLAGLAGVADYERQDRGVKAQNLYMVAPPLLEPTPERPDPRKQPTRGALMPSVLAEVGSITLAAEQDLLASAAGQAAAANGIYAALVTYFAERPQAVHYALPALEGPGSAPQPIDGDGPPFWVADLPGDAAGNGIPVLLTNTGTEPWPAELALLAGWAESDQPYLRVAPDALVPLPVDVPSLAPGESVELRLLLEPPADAVARQVMWVTLAAAGSSFADLGSPPLQLAWPSD